MLPTLLDAVGGKVPDHVVEGRSLLPMSAAARSRRGTRSSASSTRLRRDRQALGRQPRRLPGLMVRTDRWKYVEWPGYAPQLFDLESDPGEYQDLGSDRGTRRSGAR